MNTWDWLKSNESLYCQNSKEEILKCDEGLKKTNRCDIAVYKSYIL